MDCPKTQHRKRFNVRICDAAYDCIACELASQKIGVDQIIGNKGVDSANFDKLAGSGNYIDQIICSWSPVSTLFEESLQIESKRVRHIRKHKISVRKYHCLTFCPPVTLLVGSTQNGRRCKIIRGRRRS